MSTAPVTVENFGQFVTATGRDMQGCDTYDGEWKHRPADSWEQPGFAQAGTHPVTCVSWNDAEAYATMAVVHDRASLSPAERLGMGVRSPGRRRHAATLERGRSGCLRKREHRGRRVRDAVIPDGRYSRATTATCTPRPWERSGRTRSASATCWATSCSGPRIAGTRIMPAHPSTAAHGPMAIAPCMKFAEVRGSAIPTYVRADYRNRFPADYRTSTAGIRLVRDIGP